jgi:hypothetical protein
LTVGLPLLLLSCTNGDNNSGKSDQNHVLHFQSYSNYINVASLVAAECNITNENQLYCDITVQTLSFDKEPITATTDYFN